MFIQFCMYFFVVRFTDQGIVYSVLNYENRLPDETRLVGLDLRNNCYILNHKIEKNLRICDFDIDEQHGKIYLSTELFKPNSEHPEGELHDNVYEFDIKTETITDEYTILWDINDGKEGRLESILCVPELEKIYVISRYYQGGIKAVVILKKNGKLLKSSQIPIVDAPIAICKSKEKNELYILGYYHSENDSRNLGIYVIDIYTDKQKYIIDIENEITASEKEKLRNNKENNDYLIGIDSVELESTEVPDERHIHDNNIMAIDELNNLIYLVWRSSILVIDTKNKKTSFLNLDHDVENIQFDYLDNALIFISRKKSFDEEIYLNRLTKEKLEYFKLPYYIKEIIYFTLNPQLDLIALNVIIRSTGSNNESNIIVFYPIGSFESIGNSKSSYQWK